ncbi:electron transfer flavoprotein subunit beta/FixA family protein [Arthrobacter sp. NyZ413]|uniref:electron transfer flavoprotein subunit beta/FixA family protein n=1 Tax=Arthrobacter sp. NyZ413 TaxID=3144669 RepID=UPI003BF816B7
MKIVVLIKDVPDTYGDRHLDIETGLAARDRSERVLDEIGERSLELALTLVEANPDTEIVALSVGPDSAADSLRKALAIGAHRAVHVVDEGMHGADIVMTAEVIAAALRRIGFDLVIAGNLSTDGSAGVIAAAVAELLEVPQLAALSSVELADSVVRGSRAADEGTVTVMAQLPAVVSVTEALPDARLPNFKGIMAAKKKPLETLSLDELGIIADAPDVPRSILVSVAVRPPRAAGVKIVDDGTAAERLADFLVENGLVQA